MSMTDPIAAMLTTLRNGAQAKKSQVHVPDSKLKRSILDVFKREGYIRGYEVSEVRKNVRLLVVELKYYQGETVIKEISRISKPSRRVYCAANDIPKIHNGLGIGVLSTSSGVLSDAEARKSGLGGELICKLF